MTSQLVNYGSKFQLLTYEQQVVVRAALAGFIAEKPVWVSQQNDISCIDCCIESAGVDWGVWDEDPGLVEAIQRYSQLPESEIERIIETLSTHIRLKAYSSRSVS